MIDLDGLVTGAASGLLHSLWILPVVALACFAVLKLASGWTPITRYRFCQAMLTIGVGFILGCGAKAYGAQNAKVASALNEAAGSQVLWQKIFIPADWITFVWLAIATAGLLLLVWRAAGLAFARTHSRQATPDIAALVDQEARELLGQNRLAVRVTDFVASPFVFGIRKPVLLLPADLPEVLGPGQLRLIARHEIAHIRNRDVLSLYGESVARSMFFFNPAMHVLLRMLGRERERAADSLAAPDAPRRGTLARALAVLADKHSETEMPALSAGAAGGDLRDRVLDLLGMQPREDRSAFRVVIALSAFAAFGATASAAIVPLPAHQVEPDAAMLGVERANSAASTDPFDESEAAFEEAERAFDRGDIATGERLVERAEALHDEAERTSPR